MPAQTPVSQVPPQFGPYIFFVQLRTAVLSLYSAVFGGPLQPGFPSAAIASATTIAPTTLFSSVTGSASIQTITPALNLLPGARLTLIAAPGSGWSVVTGGNVAAPMSAVTPGNAYPFVWDGTSWYPEA